MAKSGEKEGKEMFRKIDYRQIKENNVNCQGIEESFELPWDCEK